MRFVSVQEGYNYLVERFGKYVRTLSPGLHVIYPFEEIAYKVLMKDIKVELLPHVVITMDNAPLLVTSIAFVRIIDAFKAMYEIQDYHTATEKVLQSSVRSVVGQMSLDDALFLKAEIKENVRRLAARELVEWGIQVKSVGIQNIRPSEQMTKAMEEQAAAKRYKKATITRAEGEAKARNLLAEADQQALDKLSAATQNGQAVTFYVGQEYLKVMKGLSASDNAKIIVLPADLPAALKGFLTAYSQQGEIDSKQENPDLQEGSGSKEKFRVVS